MIYILNHSVFLSLMT